MYARIGFLQTFKNTFVSKVLYKGRISYNIENGKGEKLF